MEGIFDLLSFAVLNEFLVSSSSIIVLNSIAFIKDIEHLISNYTQVHLYLDNDNAGQDATKYLTKNYNHIIDKSNSYKNHKDLNDFLCHERR